MVAPNPVQRATRARRPSVVAAPASASAPAKVRQLPQAARKERVMGTERVLYEDETGRRWTVLVPEGHPEQAEMGMVLGPPDTSSMGLPEDIAVRLHNELQDRGLLTRDDLRHRERELQAALQAALRLNVQRLMGAYR